jgi:hypothetical protein
MTASPELGRVRGNQAGNLFPASLPDRGDIGAICDVAINNSGNIQCLSGINYFTNQTNTLK